MAKRLKKLMDEKTDSVRLYRICESCKSRVSIMGLGEVSEDPDIVVV